MQYRLKCFTCSSSCVKNGKSKNGTQRLYCKQCRKTFQDRYQYKAWYKHVNTKIALLTREGCGIRSIARLVGISVTTVMRRIRLISKALTRPDSIFRGKEYQLDEMRTFVGNKTKLYWIVYAIEKSTGSVVDFKVGRRNLKTLAKVVDTLLLSEPSKVSTDKFALYGSLLPESVHYLSPYNINHIERRNLSVRTHLKRLNRKTICFSRSVAMLEACLRIYFWGGKATVMASHVR
jgi:insertion element IS1 protein InsB